MMMMMKPTPMLLLLFLLPVALTEYEGPVPIKVEVVNSLLNTSPLTYSTEVVYRGILLGAMRRLMKSDANFKFTYTEDPNYGPYLESVNGLAGNTEDRTYWQLQVESPDGKITTPDVGIGCYIPKANEKIILRFTKW